MKNILNIIKDSNYNFSIFDKKLIYELESKIAFKNGKCILITPDKPAAEIKGKLF